MSERRVLAGLVVTVILVAACVEGDDSGAWAIAVDTLPDGRLHVVNTPPASGVEPTWRIEEELRIGQVEAEGPATFGQVKGVAVLSDGRIAVLDAQAQELRLFDVNGAHLASYGGQGGGPGEMQDATGLMLGPGDSLWVPDVGNGRMSVYDATTGFARSSRMPFLSYRFVWSGIMTVHGHIWKPSITLAEERRPILRVYGAGAEAGLARELTATADGGDLALLDTLPLPAGPPTDPQDPPGSFFWQAPGGLPRGYIGVPYYASGETLLDPAGVIWTTKPGDPSYRIARWAPGGDTTLILETRRPLVPVTAAERDSAVDRIRGILLERGVSARQDWSKIPEYKPAVASMFVDDDGRLWVETASPDSLIEYDVYDRGGGHVGTAVTALNLWRYVRPTVREDRFWAVVTDELDVSYVVRARLTRIQR